MAFSTSTRTAPQRPLTVKFHKCHLSRSDICDCGALEQVPSLKYLGVVLDEHLTWELHIMKLASRVRKLLYIFKKLKVSASVEIINIVYNSLCKSILSYCVVAWGGAAKSHIEKLERAQRAALKVAFRKPFLYPTEALYKECGHLQVRQLYIFSVVLRFHKTALTTLTISHRHIRWKLPPRKTEFFRRTFTWAGPYIYNKIDTLLNILPLLRNQCKAKLHKWLLSMSNDETEKFLQIVM